MSRMLPEGYVFVKTISEKQEYEGGFEYSIQEVSLIKNDKGDVFLRVYENICSSEANGRPCTYEKDSCYPVKGQKHIRESNWKRIVFDALDEEIVFKTSGGDYVDEKTLNMVRGKKSL